MIRHFAATLMALAVVTATPAEATPSRIPAADREVVFTADGTTVYGTLHVPERRAGQRLRAALLLPGSGPTDRDGNQPPGSAPDTLTQLADALDEDGIASLRFDKYGTGRTGLGAYQDHPEELDYPAFIRQAQTAYKTLREQPETDPRELLVVGHSEGAMTGLILGSTVHPRPSGLALLQPQAIRLLDLVTLQLKDQIAEATRQGSSHRSSSAPSTRPSTPLSTPCANTDRSTPPTCSPRSPSSSSHSKAPTPGSWTAMTPSTHRTPPPHSGREPRCC